MAVAADTKPSIPWYSWVGLVAFVAGGVVLILLTSHPVVADWLRWAVTIAWIVAALGVGIYEKLFKPDAATEGEIDTRPFDRWTFIHAGAGVVFGFWHFPLAWLVGLVILWEVFEALVPGFGEGEIFLNRAVDVGVALLGWLVVVLIVVAAAGASFPIV